MSAASRGSFAPAQALVASICRIGRRAGGAIDPDLFRFVQILTALLLIGCAAYEFWLGGRAFPLVLLASGAVLVLAAWHGADDSRKLDDAGSANPSDAFQSEIILQLTAQRAADHVKPAASSSLSHEAWGDLMARVSHDLRTPLNAVIGFSDVMDSELFGPVGDGRYREYITHIRNSGRELLRSAEDTLAMTALLGGAASAGDSINLEALTCEAARSAGVAAVDVAVDPDIDVIGERRGLRQALVNLLSEGHLRAHGGGQVRVGATVEDEFVIVEVTASGGKDTAASTGQEASLHVCMARVLLELQGARLIEIAQGGEWRAVTVVSRAAQTDFFAAGTVPMGWKPRARRDLRVPA